MNYARPQLRRELAAHYALGTLGGGARRRFEQLLPADADLRRELRWWEQRLAMLALKLKPVAPRDVVWLGLQHRIGQPAVTPISPGIARQWRAMALLATAASVALAIALSVSLQRPPPEPQIVTRTVPAPAVYVAMLQPREEPSSFVITVTPSAGRMKVKVLKESDLDARFDRELWVVAGGKPVSAGLLPRSGEAVLAWPKDVPFEEKLVLAISREPAGGSPTGAPTGPVLATGEILQAS